MIGIVEILIGINGGTLPQARLKCRDVDVEVEVDDSDDTAHYVSLP
jgi:hypothetical protein